LSFSFLKDRKLFLSTKLLLKSLELDTIENYKAFNGLGMINIIVGLELLWKKNSLIDNNPDFIRKIFDQAKHFLEKSYFYSLNSQEINQTVKLFIYYFRC